MKPSKLSKTAKLIDPIKKALIHAMQWLKFAESKDWTVLTLNFAKLGRFAP